MPDKAFGCKEGFTCFKRGITSGKERFMLNQTNYSYQGRRVYITACSKPPETFKKLIFIKRYKATNAPF